MGTITAILCILFGVLFVSSDTASSNVKFMHKHGELKNNEQIRTPIVMIPGVLGSVIEARINRTVSPSLFCKYQQDWTTLWLSYEYLTPLYVNCWVEDIRLKFDQTSGLVKNSTGVEIRNIDFGSTSSFEYLDPAHHSGPGSVYFINLVNALVDAGYVKGKDLKGAPFDWRLSPKNDQMKDYFEHLTSLIESTYHENGNRKVMLLAHSMGNMILYYMLRNQKQDWKDKYLDSHVSINAPYIGSVKALKAITSGETEGHPFVLPKLKLREAIRTMPSSYLMLPRPGFWPADKRNILVTFERNYTVDDYEEIMERLQCPQSECYEHWKHSGSALGDMKPPNVAVHCIYGTGKPTAESLIYDKDLFPDETPILQYGDGDGTVNVWSGSYCLNWRDKQTQPIFNINMPGNDHVGLLSNSTLHKYVIKIAIKDKNV